jgi:hypothetical protein
VANCPPELPQYTQSQKVYEKPAVHNESLDLAQDRLAKPPAPDRPEFLSSDPLRAGPELAGRMNGADSVAYHTGSPEEIQIASSQPALQESESSSEPMASSDQVADFVGACCVISSEKLIIAKDLYNAYVEWCQEIGQEPLVQRSFGMKLTTLGFQRRRRGRGRHWWLGVGLEK